jgi:hypothetical protein
MSLCRSVLIAIFHAIEVNTYGRENNFGDVLKMAVLYSPILFYNGLPSTPKDFYEQANHIRGPQTNFM